MQSQSPSEWCSVTCEQIVIAPKADIVDGPFGSNLKASEYTDSGVPIARIQNVKRFKFIDKNIRFVTSTKAEELKRHSFIGGDILITKLGDPLGLACEVPNSFDSGIIVADLVRLRANTSVCSKKFIIYLLNSPVVIAQLEKHIKGSTRPRINLGIIRGLELPLPPLAEQEEIAHRLEIMLAQVESTQARLAHIPDIIKRFRQSVLAAAVSGKLTEEWRKPCPYQSINKDLTAPSCWSKCYLGEIVNYVTSGSRGWAKYYSTNGSLFIRSQDISADQLIIEDAAFVDLPAKAEGTRTKVELFDLLVTITGANVTKCALVDVDLDDAYVSQHVALIRLADSSNAKFLDLVLKSPNAGRKQLTTMAYGGGKPGLNLQNIKDVIFALPSQEEQTEIVRRVEQLFAYADTLEQQAKAAKERVDNLTQAILAKAFRGELTADWRAANPELISGDNSAAALLARIQAERATAKPRKRASKPAISPTSSGVPQ